MTTITPRWEWRTFGSELGSAEDVFDATPNKIQESGEIYFLSAGGANVKVRDDLMDIKVLKQVDQAGLEQWMPVLKAGFPLSHERVAEVFAALGISQPVLDEESYSLDQFVDRLIEPHPEVRAVEVHKRRVRYVLGDCMAEFTDVTVDGVPTQTVAVESTSADAVVATVRDLGFGDYVNINYPKGLQSVIEPSPARFAVIDVGTNSVKYHLGERGDDRSWTTVADRAEVTRLGESLEEEGTIAAAAAERTAVAVADMVDEAKTNGALAIAAVGTAGLRIARNRAEVIETIRSRSGVTVEVISGEEESRLAYLAVQASLDLGDGSLVVFDTGGGSTQFTFGVGPEVQKRFSVDVGAVRYTERFGLGEAVSPDVLADAMMLIDADLSSLDGRSSPAALVGMGGAVTNITAVSHSMGTYDPEVVQGTVLDRAEIDRQIELYRSMDAEARRSIVGLQPKRADVILAGACIVRTVMDKLDQETLTVCDRGLRHGVLLERFGRLASVSR